MVLGSVVVTVFVTGLVTLVVVLVTVVVGDVVVGVDGSEGVVVVGSVPVVLPTVLVTVPTVPVTVPVTAPVVPDGSGVVTVGVDTPSPEAVPCPAMATKTIAIESINAAIRRRRP